VDDPKAPAHGFVRTKAWQLESVAQARGAVTVSMLTESDDNTKGWWPAAFRLVHHATFGPELISELVLTNTGSTSLRFEEALHAYYRVGDIKKVRLQGLEGIHYLDKTDRNQEKAQRGEIVIVSETDRVYLNTLAAVELEDSALRRRTRVTKQNSRTTVVWNSWVQKARTFSDLADGEWTQMICIESSNVGDFAVVLAPGEQHTMKAIITTADS